MLFIDEQCTIFVEHDFKEPIEILESEEIIVGAPEIKK